MGSNQPASAITAAYDALAPGYDTSVAGVEWVRRRLWARMDALFAPGARVLDVTAGTGLDAAYLAQRGVRVLACDRSPGMLARLRARGLDVPACAMDFNAPALALAPVFDGVLSTFAGLNTAGNLAGFAEAAAAWLRPGGVLLLHLLNRWPLLDLLRPVGHLRLQQAWAAARRGARPVNLGGVVVAHRLYAPGALYRRCFAPRFEWGRAEALGLLRPIDARWGRGLEPMERRLASAWPWYGLGTFFELELFRR